MTVDEALHAITCIVDLHDDTLWRGQQMARMAQALIEDPETFWESYFDILSEDDPMRERAERLILSGKINEASTFDELAAILEQQ